MPPDGKAASFKILRVFPTPSNDSDQQAATNKSSFKITNVFKTASNDGNKNWTKAWPFDEDLIFNNLDQTVFLKRRICNWIHLSKENCTSAHKDKETSESRKKRHGWHRFFFQSKEIGQDGGEKKSSGSKGNGEKVHEPEGDLKVHIFTNERIWVFLLFHLSHISRECNLNFFLAD